MTTAKKPALTFRQRADELRRTRPTYWTDILDVNTWMTEMVDTQLDVLDELVARLEGRAATVVKPGLSHCYRCGEMVSHALADVPLCEACRRRACPSPSASAAPGAPGASLAGSLTS